jgi:hypothetical protein
MVATRKYKKTMTCRLAEGFLFWNVNHFFIINLKLPKYLVYFILKLFYFVFIMSS